MRIGFLGPSEGDLALLERSAAFLLRQHVARAVYLGAAAELDRCVVQWAQRLVGDDPTDDAAWRRAVDIALNGAVVDIDWYVERERARMGLRALVSLPEDATHTVETFGELSVMMATSERSLVQNGFSDTSGVLVACGDPEATRFESRGASFVLKPGKLSKTGGIAILETDGASYHVVVYGLRDDDVALEVLRGVLNFPEAPRTP